jgi:hypothetical protein
MKVLKIDVYCRLPDVTFCERVGISAISGFRRDVDEICALLGYYAASNGNHLPTFRDNVSVPSSSPTRNLPKFTFSEEHP